MNLSFKQAIDLHQCLRYIEACQEAIYGNDNTSDNIEVGDVSVTFHFDDGETFLDSLIVSGSEFNKGHRLRFGGRPCSEETKKKLSEIMKKRIADGSTKMPHFQKAVIVIKDGRIVGHYPSATEMARRLGITKSIIIRVCLGIRKSYRGCNLFYECDSDKWMKLIKE